MTEFIFNKKGFAAAGFVGVLSLVLMVGVLGYAAWSTKFQSKDTSTHAARKEVETVASTIADVGLKQQDGKFNIHIKWAAFKNPDPKARVSLSIVDRKTGEKVPGTFDRVLGITETSKDFEQVPLAVGNYIVKLRYIPPEGTTLEQQKDFEITPLLFEDTACLKFNGVVNSSGFYDNEKDNRPGNYHLRNKEFPLGKNQQFVVYVADPREHGKGEANKLTARITLKGLRAGVDFKTVDGNGGCKITNAGFSCDFDSGAARYSIGSLPDGFDGQVILNYQIDRSGLPTLKCGPIPIRVVGPPPP